MWSKNVHTVVKGDRQYIRFDLTETNVMFAPISKHAESGQLPNMAKRIFIELLWFMPVSSGFTWNVRSFSRKRSPNIQQMTMENTCSLLYRFVPLSEALDHSFRLTRYINVIDLIKIIDENLCLTIIESHTHTQGLHPSTLKHFRSHIESIAERERQVTV